MRKEEEEDDDDEPLPLAPSTRKLPRPGCCRADRGLAWTGSASGNNLNQAPSAEPIAAWSELADCVGRRSPKVGPGSIGVVPRFRGPDTPEVGPDTDRALGLGS